MFFDAVIFDWRGTLVTTLSEQEWVHRSMRAAGRTTSGREVQRVMAA